jgi:hypothetical protein
MRHTNICITEEKKKLNYNAIVVGFFRSFSVNAEEKSFVLFLGFGAIHLLEWARIGFS